MADKAQNVVKLHTVKLIQKLLSRKGIRATVRGTRIYEKKHQAGVYWVTMHFSIVDPASVILVILYL